MYERLVNIDRLKLFSKKIEDFRECSNFFLRVSFALIIIRFCIIIVIVLSIMIITSETENNVI